VSDTVGGPTLHTIRGPATNVVLPPRLRRTAADTTFRRLENPPGRDSVTQRAQAQTSFRILRHPVIRWLDRMVLAGFQRAPIACFGFTGRSINSPTYFPVPAFESV
jgi:hypothetical protein